MHLGNLELGGTTLSSTTPKYPEVAQNPGTCYRNYCDKDPTVPQQQVLCMCLTQIKKIQGAMRKWNTSKGYKTESHNLL